MSEFSIEAFVNTHDQSLAAVAGLSEDQLQWKQAPHIWSVQEVLSHLVDHSIVVSFRIRDILAGTTAQPPAFNQDAWVNGQYSNEGRAGDILKHSGAADYNSLSPPLERSRYGQNRHQFQRGDRQRLRYRQRFYPPRTESSRADRTH